MPKITEIHWRIFEKFLTYIGCHFSRQKGSHRSYWKEGLKRPVVIQGKGKVPVTIIKTNLRTLDIDHNTYLQILSEL